MTRTAAKLSRPPLRRTHCNRAALLALGLAAVAGAPVHAAPAGTVLPPNTIPVLRGLVSQYSNSATFATTPNVGTGGRTLTITQLVPKIILDWNNFDIGNGSVVQFVQPSSTAAVLNRIYSADPTIVQGAIKANGQVYLVNQNGILFDRGTQIDVNTLVASSLNIDDAVFMKGVTSGGLFTPAFAGGYDATGATVANTTPGGQILIGANGPAGAAVPKINATTGGAVVIIAPVIDNRTGIITSPDGQVMLAAGNAAYLDFSATNDPGFRGMLVEVTAPTGQDLNLSSYIRNAGTVTSDRGNVTFAGLAINQAGRVSASSALLTNGSIYLQAATLNDAQRGAVTMTAASVTETPLDLTDTTTMHQGDDWSQYRPVVKISGAQIDVEGRITSPSGAVSLDASDPANKTDARVYLGAGATIDASGAWSTAPDSSNLLTFKVTSNELADSPDQKSGILLGKTVTVDLRAGSTLLDLSGYQANQSRTLVQKASQGGVVNLSSTGDVVEHADATINVSGGGIHYTGATESTTQLIGADGKLYDITTAPEQLAYTAIADSFVVNQPRWGYSQTYSNLLMGASMQRPDYTQGSAGGAMSVTLGAGDNGLVLDGVNLAGVTVGSQQLATAPRGGTLTLGFFDPTKTGAQDFGIGDVVLLPGATSSLPAGFDATTPLGDDRKGQTLLSTDLFSAGQTVGDNIVSTGFSTVTINANGRVTVPENVTLAGPVGGSLTVQANQVEVDGHVSVPAGSVTFNNVLTAGTATSAVTDSSIVVAQGAGIATRGTWTNNAIPGTTTNAPSAMLTSGGAVQSTINGGSITLDGAVVDLAAGSTLDVTAGGVASSRGALSGGTGGSIALSADATGTTIAHPMVLGGTLFGEGFANGGSLSVTTSGTGRIGAPDATVGLDLAASFFTSGGFASYTIATAGDLDVDAGTTLQPQQQNLVFDNTRALQLPTGADVTTVAPLTTLAANLRKPTSLSLGSTGGALTLATGSSIATDPGATVTLSGATGVSIDGKVSAPAGTINVNVNPGAVDNLTPAPQFELGSHGVLSATGAFVQKPSDVGLVQGTLSDAGSVNIKAQKATIALDAGSVIDVSGTSQVVDQATPVGSAQPYTQVLENSNAGTLSIASDDSVTLGGALRGNAGGTAAGGSFALTFTERGDFADTTSGRRIVVSQTGAAQPAVDGEKDVLVSVDKLVGGGFDKLRLTSEDRIVFADSAALNFKRGVTLDTQAIQVADSAAVLVSATSVSLADSFGARVPRTPGDSTDPRTVMDSTLATVAQPTLAGTGSFAVTADTIDVTGSVTISGTQSERLSAADDLRLSGRTIGSASSAQGATLQGSLTTAGDLTLSAAQIYPTTGSTFKVAVADGLTGVSTANGLLTIASSGATPGAVYSAGGTLTLAADNVDQGGVVKAPQGTLDIDAGKTLTLATNSVTSVSAQGLTVPYGETQSGVTWTYAATGSDPTLTPLSAPPAKQISLNAPAIDMKAGATVDVSGGGDVAAIEFVPGNGGSKDALIQPNTYAIIPAANLSAMPVDPDIALTNPLGFGKDNSVYNSIRIGPGGAVPAGTYVLLPGYYGLMAGGYVVQLLTGNTYANLQPGQTATLANGQKVVPGVMAAAGTDVASANTIGVVVSPGSTIAKLADYTVTTSSYFATLAGKNGVAEPRLPTDGGQLAIAATQQLTLDGNLVADLPTATSRSAEVDIAADKIALVDQVGRGDIPSGYLQIDSSSLSRLDASLLIGGVRSTDATGLVVTPQASDIIVANGAATELKAPEVILAATDSITVRSGSLVEGGGARPSVAEDFTVGGSDAASGAILRAANSGLANVTRPATDASQGTITIAAGATLAASGSLALDATRTTTSNGTISVAAGGALALVSGTLSLGETDGVAGLQTGLVLDNAQLASFDALGSLTLKSYHDTDLYGNAQVGSALLKNLVLDSGSIVGRASASGAPAAAQITAGQVTLLDTSSGTPVTTTADPAAGMLAINAGQITLGAGDKTISGYSNVQLRATGELVAAGTGSLQTISPLDLQAARIDSVGGADQAWSARDGSAADAGYRPITIEAVTPATPLADSTALGSRLQITGSSITDGGAIAMKAGSVTLQALGAASSDGVQLTSGASIAAGGATQDFQGTTAIADAGQVSISSANGNVGVAGGASIDVSAVDAGGNAGALSIQGQTFTLGGKIAGSSKLGTAGSFTLDVGSLGDFSALNTVLNTSGFTEQRDVRVRGGDLVVAAGDVVTAHHLTLESDAGTVVVNGRIDASATLGAGSVEIDGQGVTVANGARIDASGTSADASATAAYAPGGAVTLVATTGTLDLQQGAVIDVRSGAKGASGSVLLRAPRTADSLQATLNGQVLSQRTSTSAAGEIDVEGNRVYGPDVTGQTITAAMIAGYAADNVQWMGGIDAAALTSNLRGDDSNRQADIHVRPAVEVRAAADLTIADPWDLTTAGWLVPSQGATTTEAGSLVVRAAGNLTLQSVSLGNPDNGLPAAATWNIALTSGADLTAANTARNQSTRQLAAQAATGTAGIGDLTLDSSNGEASVRTGTGSIRLSAGNDFVIKSGTDPDTGDAAVGVVYTAGVAAITDPLTAPQDARFTQGGGNVAISAQHDAIGAGNEWMTEWFRSATQDDGGLDLGMWWAWRQTFHDGVGALGGGNVSIVAGHDINDLSAWAPTSAIKIDGTTPTLQTYGGGNVSLRAGNDILGGQYMVSLGQGTMQAGGRIGDPAQGVQLYLMGASGDAALAQADFKLVAGQSIEVHGIDNPGTLFQSQSFGSDPSFNTGNVLQMLSYSSNSNATLSALSGDVSLGNRPDAYLTLNPSDQRKVTRSTAFAAVYPSQLDITAFTGDIINIGTASGAYLFPSVSGQLKLLAGGNVTGMNIDVSDVDPSIFAIQNMSEDLNSINSATLKSNAASPNRITTSTSTDPFVEDVVALDGSVTDATFTFPERSRIWASKDITGPSLNLQNTGTGDVTEIIAGTGSISRPPVAWGIGGPGALLVQAGADIDLGTGALSSYGNQRNGSLVDASGASITLVAGVTGTVDVTKLDAAFAALTKAGTANDKAAAQAVISALFGKGVGHGNIDSYNTSIQSNAGADINLLAPGGNITVGLTTPSPDTLIGVVTTAGGAIRSYLDGDFDINQGKVVTAQGGDILIYTADGSIDAGKGAKTSATTPPPTRTPILDSKGNLLGFKYTLPVAVSGSGIQTVTSKPNGPASVAPPAGNIFLFAPAGTIDAGEAGIASGGSIFVAALTVLNADNISSVGTSTGVPQVVVGSVASTVAASGATTSASAQPGGDAAAQAAQAAAAANAAAFRPAILTVEVLGFGDKNCKEQDKDCFAK